MLRRNFIKNAALSAVAVSTTGFIHFDGKRYVGDCETTSDILGPFYRPGSPVRNNLVIKGARGQLVELSGTIRHTDCVRPCKKAKVELWHCDSEGVYDNSTKEFRYRGTSYADDQGRYAFNTVLPVPYDAGGGMIRPAHFHLMITAEGYPPLVTQLYFSGDNNIQKDPWASAAAAKKRVLEIQTLNNGTKKVVFDVSLSGQLTAEPASLDKLAGIYTDEKNRFNRKEIFISEDALWVKNEVFGNKFEYAGDNTFRYPDKTLYTMWTLQFELMKEGKVRLTESTERPGSGKKVTVAVKEK